MNLLVSYTSLEPSYFQSTGVRTPGFTTGAAVDLFTSTSFLYSLAIMICVVTAGAMYMRAGLYRMESSERGVKKSNEEIKRVTLGLLGVLSLFVILYTFNKGLLTGDVNLNALKTSGFVSDGGGDFGGAGATSDFPEPVPTTPSTNTSEQANWSALTAAGIRITSTSNQTTPCTVEQLKQEKPTCTSLAGMPQSVISMLIELKNTCPGSMQVVGGTEPGHKTHGPGKAAVDVDNNDPGINTCIRKFPSGPSVGNWCTATYSRFGFVFCDEKGTSHWHVFK